MRKLQVETIRSQFPALEPLPGEQRAPVYFDGPGGTQMAQQSIDKMVGYIKSGMANLHGTFSTSIKTDELLEEAKAAVGDLLNCEPQEVAFGQNMTSLAFQISRNLRSFLKEGDEIVVTEQDHRANVDPWISLQEETGAVVKFIPLDKEHFKLNLDGLDKIITSKTRLVAAGLSSNLTGTITDIDKIINRAKKINALTIVDAVHAVPHFKVNFKKIDCDILLCSAYKFFGPHLGMAVIKADLFKKLRVFKLEPAPKEIPYKLETGTQNHEAIAGLCGAIDFIAGLGQGPTRRDKLREGIRLIEEYEETLSKEMEDFLRSVPEIRLYRASEKVKKAPTFAFTIRDINSREAAKFFAENYNLNIGDGHFYASTQAEVYEVNETGGWIRIGFAPYNTMEEVEMFKRTLKDFISSSYKD